MNEQLEILTSQQIDDLLADMPTKKDSLSQEFGEIPKEGTFNIVEKRYYYVENGKVRLAKTNEIEEYAKLTKVEDMKASNVKPSIGLRCKSGHYVSSNTLFAFNLLKEITQKDKGFTLKSDIVSESLQAFGASGKDKLQALQGKSFTSDKLSGYQWKNETFKKFDNTYSATKVNKNYFDSMIEAKTFTKFTIVKDSEE